MSVKNRPHRDDHYIADYRPTKGAELQIHRHLQKSKYILFPIEVPRYNATIEYLLKSEVPIHVSKEKN